MGYLKNVEIALELEDRDRARLKQISEEVTQNAANSSYTVDDLLKQYNLTEAELLTIRNREFDTEKTEPGSEHVKKAMTPKAPRQEESR